MVEAIQKVVDAYRQQALAAMNAPNSRPIGWLKGKWELPDSFFEPLPEEMLTMFEGGNPR